MKLHESSEDICANILDLTMLITDEEGGKININLFLKLFEERINDLSNDEKALSELKNKILKERDEHKILDDLESLVRIIGSFETLAEEQVVEFNNLKMAIIRHYIKQNSLYFDKFNPCLLKDLSDYWSEDNKNYLDCAINNMRKYNNKIKNTTQKLAQESPLELYKFFITETVINAQNKFDQTFLIRAFQNKDIELFEKLISTYKVDVNVHTKCGTIFHYISGASGNVSEFFEIAEKYADIDLLNAQDIFGKVPLIIALGTGQHRIVSALVMKGAKVPEKLINQVKEAVEKTLKNENNEELTKAYVQLIYTRKWHNEELFESFKKLSHDKMGNEKHLCKYAFALYDREDKQQFAEIFQFKFDPSEEKSFVGHNIEGDIE
jgi:ankyrin repeat protein